MALSHSERRAINRIDRQLAIEDPTLARLLQTHGARRHASLPGRGCVAVTLIGPSIGAGAFVLGLAIPDARAGIPIALAGLVLVVASFWCGVLAFLRRLPAR